MLNIILQFNFLSILGVIAYHQQTCQSASDLNRWWYNSCSRRCICEEVVLGEFVWVCYKERKEFTCMSASERELFINTYKAISTNGHPEYAQYTALLARHSTGFGTIHTTTNFLPWHRWFSAEMEELLQNVNCNVTLPWWNTAKSALTPWAGSPWGNASSLLGSSGSCVSDGPFSSTQWTNNAHGCLKRSLTGTLPTSVQEANVLLTSAGSYSSFSDDLETIIHNLVHVKVGGTMMQSYSPEAPEFFLHHNHIDKLWDDWQKKSAAHLSSYSFDSSLVMPYTFATTPASVNSLKASKVDRHPPYSPHH